jgi:hypothetical protein
MRRVTPAKAYKLPTTKTGVHEQWRVTLSHPTIYMAFVLPVQGYDVATAKVKLSGHWADWWFAHGSFETGWSCRWEKG